MNRNHTGVQLKTAYTSSPIARTFPRILAACALSLFATGAGILAQEPAGTLDFRFPAAAGPLEIRSGGEASLRVDALIPAKNHIYIKHANEISMSVLTDFKSLSPGWAVAIEKRPEAKRYKDDYILSGRGARSAGSYELKLYETRGRDPGPKFHAVKIEITTQMCNSQTNRCYRPAKITKTLRARVHKEKTRSATAPKHRGGVAWIQNYDRALSRARSTGRNIFVIITAPTWCGYCKVLEKRVFAKSAVARRLNAKFVPLQLLDSNADRNKFSFDGYPTMLIAGSNGKRIAEVYGRDESSFLQAIRRYEKDDGENNSDGGDGAAESYDFSIQVKGKFKKTVHGWERKTASGTVEIFVEHRRTKSYIILKNKSSGQFVALPVKGGQGLIYRDNAWVPAFDVAKP